MNNSHGSQTPVRTTESISLRKVIDERNTAWSNLSFAMDTIHELENHIMELNLLVTEAQAALEASQTEQNEQKTRDKLTNTIPLAAPLWIHDIWLCHSSTESKLFTDVESHWRRGLTQHALNMTQYIDDQNIQYEDCLRLRLLRSAILYSCDMVKESTHCADHVLKKCEDYRIHNFAASRELSAIAHFIRGKNLLAQKNWKLAFWAFSRAMGAQGYRARAAHLKNVAWEKVDECDNANELSRKLSTSVSSPSALDGGFEDISWLCGLKGGE